MKVGVTGTRHGMTEYQSSTLSEWLRLTSCHEFHHGDCVGVDVEAAQIAFRLGHKIICHPPVDEKLRAFFPSDEYREAKTHFARNRDIVDETEFLIVVPFDNEWKPRGGTWYTHDYAKKKGKKYWIIWPEEKV